jgi:glycine dehydrogenase subunit 1
MPAHPYMANSTAGIRDEMLAAIGAGSVEELFVQIPPDHRRSRPLDLPPALSAEHELRRHMLELLDRNESCERNLSFLGAGCYQHHVPAVCDEIVGRAEFLTPVWGTASSDHGRNQAWFEFQSQIGELIGMDFVGLPVYSFGYAGGNAIRMAARMTGRREVLVPASLDPERLAVIRNLCAPPEIPGHIVLTAVAFDPATGRIDLADLDAKLSDRVAAVYLDNPSYLGVIESDAARIAEAAREHGAETIVGVDPSSLGVLAPPSAYGADIVVGTIQPLGIHMNAGGGAGGFIATRDDERYAREFPTLVLSLCDTIVEGERGFGITLFEQTSYGARDQGKDWTGNSVYLWAIAASVYMALLGPEGFAELGAMILQRSRYAAARIADIEGVRVPFEDGFFKEFVVDFGGTGKTVAEIDDGLRRHGIFGGKDLSADFPELGQSALYCVTEVHSMADIDRLVGAMTEVIGR